MEAHAPRTAPGSRIGEDLRGADLAGADLSGVDLSRAVLVGADLIGANLTGAILYQAKLDGAELLGADLTDANLTECSAVRTGFGQATLRGVNLAGANLEAATLSGADLTGADLRGAELRECRIHGATLVDADLGRVVLRGATLAECESAGASFRHADLRDARIWGLSGYDRADWVGVDLRGADLCGAYLMRRFAHDQNYLEEFRTQSRTHALVYYVWLATSDCGRSSTRWSLWTVGIAVSFALVYLQLPIDYGDHETVLSPLYFSVVTLTTLGFGDALPTDVASQVVVMIEVLAGYFMLGGLLTLLNTKMARRAD